VTRAELDQLVALMKSGRHEQLERTARELLDRLPDSGPLWNILGAALQLQGKDALAALARAASLLPDDATAHHNLGKALRGLERLDEAAASYRRALEIKPDDAEGHYDLGIALRLQSRTAEAYASCRKALDLQPNRAATLVLLAELRADAGQFAEAEDLFKRAISFEPESPEAWAGIASLRRMTHEDAAWLTQVQRIAQRARSPREAAHLRFAIGKYFDDVHDFEQAFRNYRDANELTKSFRARYDRAQLTQAVDLLIRHFDRNWLEQARNDTLPAARPIFIVGMPRSGTTLAEQILASHPAVFGAGELTFWNTAAATYLSSPLNDETRGARVCELCKAYLRLLAELSGNALRVVDKMPGNFMSLGLIHAALPHAAIIHMRRNPIDTCLSNYFQNFSAGRSYANDLGDLAHAYTEYLRIMDHWRAVLPPDLMLEIPYEGLVEDQEGWTRRMLDFVALPWEPRCLDFHQTNRAMLSPSRWQVRQKISRSSVERWRHYEQFVGPLLHLSELEPRRR
jgi:tetratricopeptide (TPR) repeat protein